MRRETADQRLTQEADEQLDRLVDEALGEMSAQPAPPSVKARVMAAWDERGARVPEPKRAFQWRPLPPLLRPAAALAGSLVIVLGVFFGWQYARTDRQLDTADRLPAPDTAARTNPVAAPVPPLPEAPAAAADAINARPVEPPARRRPRYVTVELPVEQVADLGPHLPGAPAGDLGDPIAPIPGPAPITIAPIETARPISEFARPVTEFPADNQPPAGEGAEAGKSGGLRR
jgi:hypothetical protein